MRYPVVLHKDRKSDFGITVPDLPGCFSAGRTYDEALANAKEAIEAHVEGLAKDGDEVPEATDLAVHLTNPEFAGAAFAMVEANPDVAGQAVRINITVPEKSLKVIDEYAAQAGMARSAFLVKSALEKVSGARARPRAPLIQHAAAARTIAGRESRGGQFVAGKTKASTTRKAKRK